MNEGQLKEIAILAKELGFKASVFPTAWLSQSLIDNVRGVGVEHVASYLLLCEIQLWLIEAPKLHLHICYFLETNKWNVDIYKYEKDNGLVNNPLEFSSNNTYGQALTTGILESLKLIKNESN